MKDDKKLKVSLIIPTKDRPEDLVMCLKSASKQTLLPDEIIIVDSSKEENSIRIKELLKSLDKNMITKIFYFHVSKQSLTFQRNYGIKRSSGDIIVFVDDDTILDKDFLLQIVYVFNKFSNENIGGVSGNLIERDELKGTSLFHKFINIIYQIYTTIFFLPRYKNGMFLPSGFPTLIKKNTNKIVETEFLHGGCSAFKRKVFDIFKFDENLNGYGSREDVDFSYRVSRQFKNYWTPYAKIIHNRSLQSRSELKIIKDKLKNSVYLFHKNFKEASFFQIFCFYWAFFGMFVLETIKLITRLFVRKIMEVGKNSRERTYMPKNHI